MRASSLGPRRRRDDAHPRALNKRTTASGRARAVRNCPLYADFEMGASMVPRGDPVFACCAASFVLLAQRKGVYSTMMLQIIKDPNIMWRGRWHGGFWKTNAELPRFILATRLVKLTIASRTSR